MKTTLLLFLLLVVFCISCKTEIPVNDESEPEVDYNTKVLESFVRETDSLSGDPGVDKMIFALPDSGYKHLKPVDQELRDRIINGTAIWERVIMREIDPSYSSLFFVDTLTGIFKYPVYVILERRAKPPSGFRPMERLHLIRIINNSVKVKLLAGQLSMSGYLENVCSILSGDSLIYTQTLEVRTSDAVDEINGAYSWEKKQIRRYNMSNDSYEVVLSRDKEGYNK